LHARPFWIGAWQRVLGTGWARDGTARVERKRRRAMDEAFNGPGPADQPESETEIETETETETETTELPDDPAEAIEEVGEPSGGNFA